MTYVKYGLGLVALIMIIIISMIGSMLLVGLMFCPGVRNVVIYGLFFVAGACLTLWRRERAYALYPMSGCLIAACYLIYLGHIS